MPLECSPFGPIIDPMRCLIPLLAMVIASASAAEGDVAQALAAWESARDAQQAEYREDMAKLEREQAEAMATLRQRHVRGLERIAERSVRRGDLAAGIQAWRAVLAVDPAHAEATAFVAEVEAKVAANAPAEATQTGAGAVDLLGDSGGAPPAPIDLLALFDPGQHAINGTWQRTPDGIAVSGTEACRAWLPYSPGERYDLVIGVRLAEGHESINPILVHGSAQPVAVLGGDGNQDSGWLRVGGENYDLNPTHRETPDLLRVARHEILIQVRPEEMLALLDGKPVIRWVPADGALGSDKDWWTLPSGEVLGLGCWGGKVLFESVVVRPHDDGGRVLDGAVADPP